jgi:tripartite-type tricarboxylate transporter receptor subunit TctC
MSLIRFAIASMAALCLTAAQAQTYPSKLIRVVNPFPAGGPADTLVRPIAQRMGEGLKVQCLVDNRPGVNGILGTEIVVKAPADGYTLLVGSTSSLPMNAAIYPKMPFDPLKDLAPVSAFSYTPQILVVHPSVPAKTVKELIALGRARQGQLIYASPSVGASPHFAAEMFSSMTGVKMLHVPYRGGALVVPDLVAGRVMIYFDSMQNSTPLIRANRVRPLAVAAKNRAQSLPEVPTFTEAGLPGFEVGTLFGLLAPAATPREIVMRLNAEVVRVMALPDIRERLRDAGAEILGNTPEEFAAHLAAEMPKWAKVAREAGIRAE